MSSIQRFFVSLPAVALLAALPACSHHAAGPVTTQVRHPEPATSQNVPTAGSFSRIVLRGSIDVVVNEGAATAVSVTGDSSVQERLVTRVEGDTLFVDFQPKGCFGLCMKPDDDAPRVTVNLPALRAATIEGSGDLRVNGSGSHPEVDLNASGSGDLRYTGDADVLRCTVDGSGDVILHGAGKRLETRVHGSGDVNAREFPVAGGLYDLDGSGDVRTVVHGGDMSVHLHGSGDLIYAGELRITSLDVSGSGEMREMGSDD